MSCLKTFLDWAYRRGHLPQKIEFDRPKNDAERRPHFDAKDWATLTRFLREWIKDAKTKSGPIVRDRVMLTNYVLILANTGIRIGEARNLRWRDVDTQASETEGGADNVILSVKGKTGLRDVVARTSDVKSYFDRIRELRCEELGQSPAKDDFIFCHRDGKPIQNFKKGYSALLDAAGVAVDNQGQKRSLYSLRHTYATFRLHEGVNQYALARNMGTSVQMLETFYGHTTNRTMATELTKTKRKQKKSSLWE
jgi:integrase